MFYAERFSIGTYRRDGIGGNNKLACFVLLCADLMFFFCFIVPTNRNLKNLPCVVLRTGAEGVCMFAIHCLKANGTHLGTCRDGYYFKSCCHINVRIGANNYGLRIIILFIYL